MLVAEVVVSPYAESATLGIVRCPRVAVVRPQTLPLQILSLCFAVRPQLFEMVA